MIHKAGYKIAGLVSTLVIIINVIGFLFIPSPVVSWVLFGILFLILVFVLRFFRKVNRTNPVNDNILLSSADGTVAAIEKVYEGEYLEKECMQVSVFMSVWNVHINWFPIDGILKYFKYHPGKFLMARLPKSSELNERTSIVVETKYGHKILIRQIAGIVARRIESYIPEIGSSIKRSEELGFIKFGSRVDLFVPLGSQIHVKIGEKVRGQVSKIATLPPK